MMNQIVKRMLTLIVISKHLFVGLGFFVLMSIKAVSYTHLPKTHFTTQTQLISLSV